MKDQNDQIGLSDLRGFTRVQRLLAADDLRGWARTHCPRVDPQIVDSVAKALGEISFAEAQAALLRINREAP